jgi:heme/copper-type cytochrome/quinol oxidase subunit 3
MILLLASLGMLFAASVVGYLAIRLFSKNAPPPGQLELSPLLWISSAIILLSSVSIALALKSIRRNQQDRFRLFLILTAGLSLLFVAVQAPALLGLLDQHAALRHQGVHLYGLVFFLILIHALHVVGGLVALGRVVFKALGGRYDIEHHADVRFVAMYWHFLDVVWMVLFAAMLLTA